MKTTRQAAILEIIEQQPVETQEELAEQLRRRGIVVTQATVSRDIKELRLIKLLSDKDGYRYAVSNKADSDLSTRLIRIFQETVLSIADAYNLIVVKTLSGSAHAASEAVDNLSWQEIVGSLAGDNTFVLIVRQVEEVPAVLERLRNMMK